MRSVVEPTAGSCSSSAISTSCGVISTSGWPRACKNPLGKQRNFLGNNRQRRTPHGLHTKERFRALNPCYATDDKTPPTTASDVGSRPADANGPTSPPSPVSPPELGPIWEAVKRDLARDMPPEDVRLLQSIKVEDLDDPGDLLTKISEEQLGPLLRSLGVYDDPAVFFVDLLKRATALQLISAGALFYGVELGAGMDSGEALRCVCGLVAGYLSRPFFQVEQLLWPLYDAGLQLLAPGAVYEIVPSAEASQAALSRLGVAVAVSSFAPQLLWGWEPATCLQFVLPLAAGWVLFDVTYMVALLSKLSR